MLLYGKERHFLMTVGASADIGDACPGGDLSRMGELFDGSIPFSKQMRSIAKIASAMSRGYEQNKKFEDPEYQMDVLTTEQILALDMNTLQTVVVPEILEAFTASTKTTVEMKESKKNEEVMK